MMRLSEIALATKGKVLGADVEINSVGTDSRAIESGQLFVALKGENFDGHDYAAQSLQQGACAVMVSQEVAGPAVLVKDTRLALGDLSAYWRNKFSMPVVAITGSNGKTTVKEMLASILKVAAGDDAKVLATQGNLNNDIGLPLTMLKIEQQHEYAVLEMGMNHRGEIRYLTKLAKPNVALVNNAGSAHIGELGSYEAIAEAKGEIFEGLAKDGIAIINADDVFADFWKKLAAQNKQMTFGLNQQANVSARYQLNVMNSNIQMTTPIGNVNFDLPAPGEHNVRNALAAATAALALNVPLNKIAEGLTHFAGVKGRLQSKAGFAGAKVIDDTYNANPLSMKAAIDVLAGNQGTRIFVMGDMAELGDDAAEMHAEIGAYAKAAKIQTFYALGQLTPEATKAFGASGKHFESVETLVDALREEMNSNVTVLVKGSRSARMERVVDLIQAGQVTENQKTENKGEKH
ncbi:MAG: UDP-N-acetylmuramoyl-tripeptide--D-alanyl-D-alanine ligase [Methylophilaceae bacterium]|nr:UDP-N-acetylmuramoyl-tripeptide--D-alanyl-D-alanine ligase [Methylophilaceae bacterium]